MHQVRRIALIIFVAMAAGVDRRVGGKTLDKGFDKWADVINIMDHWGELMKLRLCKMKGRANCPAPNA